MAIRYVSVTGDPGGDGTSPSSRWTMTQANANLQPGDIAVCAAGTYTTGISPTNSGTDEDNRITYRGENLVSAINNVDYSEIDNVVSTLTSKSYITIDNFKFSSTTEEQIVMNDPSGLTHHNEIVRCRTDSAEDVGFDYETGLYFGIEIRGNNHHIHHNVFGKWVGGNYVQIWGDENLIEYNNANDCDNGHGTIMLYGSRNILQHNYIRNHWSRAFEIVPRFEAEEEANIVQYNTLFSVGWRSGVTVEGWGPTQPEGVGDEQMIKPGGKGLIFRFNLIVNTPEGHPSPAPYNCIGHIDSYGETYYFEHLRFYHNTFLDGLNNCFSITHTTGETFFADDDRWINNVIVGFDGFSFYYNTASAAAHTSTHHYKNNIFPDVFRRASTDYTAAQVNANTGGFFPNASGNSSTVPTFVNSDYTGPDANRSQKISYNNFRLADDSPVGVGEGTHLTTVVTSATSTTIEVEDAWCFTDGHGMIDGDIIIVNGQTRTITATNPEPEVGNQTITLDSSVTVTNGDPIYLAVTGENPTIGIPLVEESELTVPSNPTVLSAGINSASSLGNSIQSVSFSPTANALLIVVATANPSGAGVTGIPSSISDTFSPSLSWTTYESEVGSSGSRCCVTVHVAKLGASPGSGQVTVTFANNCGSRIIVPYEVASDYNLTTPVFQSHSSTTFSGSTLTDTMDAAPEATSLIFAALASRGSDIAITPDPDFTELHEQMVSTNHVQHVSYDSENGAAATVWTGDLGGTGTVGLVLEIGGAETEENMFATSAGTSTVSGSLTGKILISGSAAGTSSTDATLRTAPFVLFLQPDAAASKDTYIDAGAQSANYGVTQSLRAAPAASTAKILLQFDLTSIPVGAVIDSAIITLWHTTSGGSGVSVSIHRALTDWFEGDGNNSPPSGNGSTWLLRNVSGSVAWGAAGGQAGTDYATTATDTTTVTGTVAPFDWDVTSDVQDFVDGVVTNRGWWFIVTATAARSFRSSDHPTTGERPAITVTYSIPPTEGSAIGTSTVTGHLTGVASLSGSAGGSSTVSGSLVDLAVQTFFVQPDSTSGKDTLIDSAAPTFNYGIRNEIISGFTVGGILVEGLIQFDLSAIPAQATIVSATLSLWCTSEVSSVDTTIALRRSLVEWFEGVKNGAAPDGGQDGSTWNLRNANGSLAWASPGGVSGSDYASVVTDSVLVTGINTWYDFDVATDIAGFVNNDFDNFGWWVLPVTAVTNNRKSFASSDHVDDTIRPKLTVIYLHLMEGISSGTSTASGTLSAAGYMQGSSVGTSTAVGQMGDEGTIRGDAAGTASSSAVLSANAYFVGSSSGSTFIAATMMGVAALVGLSQGTSIVSAIGSRQGQLRGSTFGLGTAVATGYAKAVGVIAAVGCTPVPLFYLTDGSIKNNGQLNIINFLSNHYGYQLKNYRPGIPQYKEGGRFSSSPLANGRRLTYRSFDNVIDIVELTAIGRDEDALIQYQQELIGFQEMVADYWTSHYLFQPVYLVSRSARESNTRYAMLYMISIPELENPYAHPFFDHNQAVIDTLTVRIERGMWLSTPPGEQECVPISSIRSWTVSGWQTGS